MCEDETKQETIYDMLFSKEWELDQKLCVLKTKIYKTTDNNEWHALWIEVANMEAELEELQNTIG